MTRSLFRLAWPVFVSRILHTLYGTADTAWVGKLGPEAIAAVATSFFASWMLFAVGDILIAGVTALVSQAIGAGRDDEAARAVLAGTALAGGTGIIAASLGWFGSPALFDFLFEDPQIVRAGPQYLSVFSLLAPVFYLTFVAESAFRSCGDSRTPMYVILGGTTLNIVLDPVMILGVGPVPRLGVRGAALATVFAETAVLCAYGVLYARGRFPLRLRRPGEGPLFSRSHIAHILRIGTPEALTGMLFSVVYVVLAHITGTFGASATAALGIVNRLESLTYLTATALGMGVATMVGQNLGARQTERAEACAHRGAALITLVAGIFTVLFLAAARPVAALFTTDAAAVAESVLFLRIVAISQVFMGWEIIYGCAFTGAGHTLPPMYVSVAMSAVRIPLAWWLAFHTGAATTGIWWTISLTGILRGLLIPAWFRLGSWKHRELPLFARPRPAPLPAPAAPQGKGI